MIEQEHIAMACAGFLLRWLFFIDNRKNKSQKEKMSFNIHQTIFNELHLIVASIISAFAFMSFVPNLIVSLNQPLYYWNGLTALSIGMSSVDIARFIYNHVPEFIRFLYDKILSKIILIFHSKKQKEDNDS